MQARSAQKRTAGLNAESSTSQHTSKKTRFVEPDDDPANFAEEVDSALENPSAKRKGRVKNEGYESDSSDDGEGVVLSRRKAEKDDEDDDMFAVGEKENQDDTPATKPEDFLRLGDIEGQEFGDEHSSDRGDESEDEDQPEDEDDAERRKKAGMGYELSSFNMREEMEEGKFAADGTYIRTFDPHGVHDRWMEGLDERDIKLARRRKRQQERLQKARMKAEEKELEQNGGKVQLEKQLIGMLKKGETVLEALQRLGARSKMRKTTTKSEVRTSLGSVGGKHEDVPTEIERITEIASNLMSLGDIDIYSKTHEELVRSIRSDHSVPSNWDPPSADVKYEYKWDVVGPTSDVFGPFSEEEMKTWYKAAYFGPTGEKVKVRAANGEWGDWNEIIV